MRVKKIILNNDSHLTGCNFLTTLPGIGRSLAKQQANQTGKANCHHVDTQELEDNLDINITK